MGRVGKKRRRIRFLPVAVLLALLLVAVAWYGGAGGSASRWTAAAGDAWARLVARATPSAGTAAPQAAFSDAGAGIEVLFAPVEPMNPWGIDDRLVALIGQARQSVDGAFYDLQLASVAEALIERHRNGVRVRLVSDSHYEKREAVQACIRAGIPVVFDRREAFMHNKFCVVDGQRVWTGSTNVTENCMYRNNNNALLLDSPQLSENYAAEFLEMFERQRFGKRSPRNTPWPRVVIGGASVECYFAPEDGVQQEIISEIAEAGATIDFMAFSFTSKPVAEAVAARLKTGVRVRGLFEARDMGSRYCQDDFLAERGAEVFADQNKYNMHHKVIIIDARTVVAGSYNFSQNAETQNDENVLIVHDAGTAARYTQEFERLIAR
jgi:phosphatidylserine/phosphatidylglycerophosphate/cardiolipin synthase-like enzyme